MNTQLKLHPPDVSNFTSSSPHRLPTRTALSALQDLDGAVVKEEKWLSTGLAELDEALGGGVERGAVTEVWGAPGVGKSGLGMQVAAGAMHKGLVVVWIDTSHPLPGPRFSNILTSYTPPPRVPPSSLPPSSFPLPSSHPQAGPDLPSSPPKTHTLPDLLDKLTHFTTPTLAHFLALTTCPTPTFPPPNTGLIVIDSLSTLLANAFPRGSDASSSLPTPGAPPAGGKGKAPKSDPKTFATSRKYALLQSISSSLAKLAALHNMAVVVLNQAVTKMREGGGGAGLVSAVAAREWENGVGGRIVLFRDWVDGGMNARFAAVVKRGGVVVAGGGVRGVGFVVGEKGIEALPIDASQSSQALPRDDSARSLKRKHPDGSELGEYEADGDGRVGQTEDYGWAEEDDEDVPEMPPQWQGSEDVLLREAEAEVEEGDDEENRDEDEDGRAIGVGDRAEFEEDDGCV